MIGYAHIFPVANNHKKEECFMKALKKPVNLLGILLVVLMLVQVVLMFLPYFELNGEVYSMQDFAWFKCEKINKQFNKLIDDYYINDYVMGIVLTFVFGVLGLLMTALEIRYAAEGYTTMGTITVKLLGYVFCVAWVLYGLPDFLGNSIHQFGNPGIQYACLGCVAVGAVIVIVRAVLSLVAFVKTKKAEQAA